MNPNPRFPVPRQKRIWLPIVAIATAAAISVAGAQEPAPATVSIDSVRVIEGDSGSVAAVLTVRVAGVPQLQDATVDFVTESRTATADDDFVAAAGTLYLAGGSAPPTGRHVPRGTESDTDTLLYQIPVTVLGDSLVEGNEWFVLRLSNPQGVNLGDSIGVVVIVNDERPGFTFKSIGLPPACGPLSPSFGDMDLDGDSDLPTERNLGDLSFGPSSLASVLPLGDHHGSAWADYNRDGLLDLVVLPYETDWGPGVRLHLMKNIGSGEFYDVAPSLGMSIVGNGETAVWGDFDGDAWPDLFAPFYAHLPPWRSHYYRNNRDGTFTEMALEARIDMSEVNESLKPEGADAVDWDGNGALDIYCASHLFLNNGTGYFRDARAEVGLPAVFDEGARFVDFDNDGDFDLYLRTYLGPRLFENRDGHFTEKLDTGLPPGRFFWGDSFADVDNDGDLDLVLGVSSGTFELWLNQGDGTFVIDPEFSTLGAAGQLSAFADVDLDGDMDAAIGSFGRGLMINHADELPKSPTSYLRVQVREADSAMVSYGAIVRMRELSGGPGSIQTRVVNGGAGYLSQDEYMLHFGGLTSGRYAIEVRWPGSSETATVVDETVNPELGNIDPALIPDRLLRIYRNGNIGWGTQMVLAVGDAPHGAGPSLGPPSPLPARTSVRLPLPAEAMGAGEIAIHDLKGRCVRRLPTGSVGAPFLSWDLRDENAHAVPSGIYFARLTAGNRTAGTQRIVVLR